MNTPSSSSRPGFESQDKTESAYRALSKLVGEWTSPRPPSLASNDFNLSAFNSAGGDDDDDGMVWTRNSEANLSAKPVMDSWNRDLIDPVPKYDDEGNDDDEFIPNSSSTKLRVTRISAVKTTAAGTPIVERASTPVMSNSSTKTSQRSTYSASPLLRSSTDLLDGEEDEGGAIMDEDEDIFPVNVQSPWVEQQQKEEFNKSVFSSAAKSRPVPTLRGGTASGAFGASPRAISPFRNEQYEFRQYHDALLAYLKARRNISDRINMNLEEQALALPEASADALALPTTAGDKSLSQEETNVEVNYLRALKTLCWARDPSSRFESDSDSRREGNFWALMQELRTLGFAALLWADDDRSIRQNIDTRSAFWHSLSMQIHASPKQLVEEMSSENAPLVLQRGKHVLLWLEKCMDQAVTTETRAMVSNTSASDKISSQKIEKIFKSCLSLILAGRLKEAQEVLRKAGQPWIAAKLGGGIPSGTERMTNDELQTVNEVKVGNVNRALWKRQMWNLSQKMNSHGSGATPEEAAIHSILANDYSSAMENSALRSWEKGMYVLLHSMWGRNEDELLHLHNKGRRRARPPFPGTQFERHELEQLKDTCELANLSEAGIIEKLAASPFEAMRGHQHLCVAISSLLGGRESMFRFLTNETDLLTNSNMEEEPDRKVSRLRFVTHLLLYLDSLSVCTTPVALEGVSESKDRALSAYVDHLANHEELWQFLVLYTSLLPEDRIVGYFPTVLARVENERERKMMIQQARDLFPGDGLDLTVLNRVVRSIINEEDDIMTLESNTSEDSRTPTRFDIRKMKSIQWLCFYEEHMSDALIAANMLLRQFLIANKFASAIMFLHDFLPSAVIESVMTSTNAPANSNDEDSIVENEKFRVRLSRARGEYMAYQTFLKAFRAFEEWSLVCTQTPFSGDFVDDKANPSNLTELDAAVARSMERRELIRHKRKFSQSVADAAETARKDLLGVLLYDGGWLVDNEDIVCVPDDIEEGQQRMQQIQALRCRLLPAAVKYFHSVCEDTASWMWDSLLDGSPLIGSSQVDVLEALDDSTEGEKIARSSFSPKFWTNQALNLAETVASDEYLVMSAFEASDLKDMLTRTSEIALLDLQYSA